MACADDHDMRAGIQSAMDGEIPHGHLIYFGHMKQTLDVMAHQLRDAQDFIGREPQHRAAPFLGVSFGEGVLHLPNHMEFAQQRRVQSGADAYEMAERLKSGEGEIFAFGETVQTGQALQQGNDRIVGRRHDGQLHAVAGVQDEELAHALDACDELSQRVTFLRGQMEGRAPPRGQQGIGSAEHGQLEVAVANKSGDQFIAHVARRTAGLPRCRNSEQKIADMRRGRGCEIAIGPIHVRTAAGHVCLSGVVENSAIDMLVVRAGEDQQMAGDIARAIRPTRPDEVAILLGAFGQLFYGFGTDEFDGGTRVQQATHLAQAHLSAADHERRAAIDDEIERNGLPDGAFRAAHGQAPMRTDEMTPGGMGGTVPPVSMLWTASNTSSHVW